ncbi:MAG TPA: type II secretion system F family protein [Micromonosporaceae bacterium]|jgi:type IV pilus assembly protein PilC
MAHPTAAVAAPPKKQSFLQMEIFPSKVKRDELMHLSRQLAAFVHAGLPLIEAVRILGEEAKSSALRKALAQTEDGLRRGETLTDCLDRHPKIFPEYYRGILRSAELTGRLDVVLDQLARYLERDLEARRKITSALAYPAVIGAMSVVTVVVLAAFVLPRFKVFFSSLNATLPLPTRMLLAVTDFLTEWWWAVAGGLIAVVLIYAVTMQTATGKYARDALVLRLPMVGETVRIALVERFCRVLASMAAAGVVLPNALRVATESLRNRVFMRQLSSVGDQMMRGEGLARPLSAVGLFPNTAARMIRVGEETGTLDAQLEVTARYYEGELDHRLKRLTAIFEPAVIVFMGLIVGFVAVALVSAMYGIFNQVDI